MSKGKGKGKGADIAAGVSIGQGLLALQAIQAKKKEKVIERAKTPRTDGERRAALQSEIDELVTSRNALAGELRARMTVTAQWGMGGNRERGQAPIGVCALYR